MLSKALSYKKSALKMLMKLIPGFMLKNKDMHFMSEKKFCLYGCRVERLFLTGTSVLKKMLWVGLA